MKVARRHRFASTAKTRKLHAVERGEIILDLLNGRVFVPRRDLLRNLHVSHTTLLRDLKRLEAEGKLTIVRGGARSRRIGADSAPPHGEPFHKNSARLCAVKEMIGKAAAGLCKAGDTVIISGGSTTIHMCPHIESLELHVLTNSLQIVGVLLQQPRTRISITGGVAFREQNILLDPFAAMTFGGFHELRMFVGASAVTRHGLMQDDIVLAQAESALLDRASELVILVDSSKFRTSAAHWFCPLPRVSTLITDSGIDDASAKLLANAGVRLIVVDAAKNAN